MAIRKMTFDEDTGGLRTLSSIYEGDDNGYVVTGAYEGDVWNFTEELFRTEGGIDFDIVHDSVNWQWVGIIVQ